MKILSLSLDSAILDSSSAVARRIARYGEAVDKYVVIVPAIQNQEVALSEKVKAMGSGGANKAAALFRVYKLVQKIFQEEKFDLITVQDQYYLALVGWLLAKKLKLGLELQLHGFEKYQGLRKIIFKFNIKRADAIRTVSRRLKDYLVSEFKIKPEKITVIPIALSLRPGDELPENNKSTDDFIFLTVGRFVPVKNILLQITALKELAIKHRNIKLWIVGAGPEKSKYEEKIKQHALEKNIEILDWQKDLSSFYRQADAFLLTSDSEGWGLAVIEAATFGLPIIMTDVGCAGEVIKNEESGLVVPVGDSETLIKAMRRIIKERELREKLSLGASRAVTSLPDWAETLKLYRQSWEKALENNKQKRS